MNKRPVYILIITIVLLSASWIYAQPNPKWMTPVTMSPPAPGAGTIVMFSATFRNAKEPSKNLRVVAGIDGANIFDQTYPSLSKGQDTVVSFKWTATAGGHTAFFQIDPMGVAGDLYPGDNRVELNFKVGGTPPGPTGKPDLIIADVSWNPTSFKNGDNVTFTIKVKNAGTDTAPPSYTELVSGGTPVGGAMTTSLNPGQISTVNINWNAVCGAGVDIFADSKGAVSESNESNNNWNKKIDCVSIIIPGPVTVDNPNFIISNVSYSPLNFSNGNNVNFKIRITNIGTGPSAESSYGFLENGAYIFGASSGGLNVGQSVDLNYTWIAKCGALVRIEADYKKKVTESNESDNSWEKKMDCSQKIIHIVQPPDTIANRFRPSDNVLKNLTLAKPNLVITDVYSIFKGPGNTIFVQFKVKNIGPGAAVPRPGAAIRLSGATKWEKPYDSPTSSLPPGESTVLLNYTFPTKCGSKNEILEVIADHKNQIMETSEIDNVWSKPINLSCGNLIVQIVWNKQEENDQAANISGTMMDEGGPLYRIDYRIRNIGTTAVGTSSYIDSISVDGKLLQKSYWSKTLAPGDATHSITYWKLKCGRKITFTADPDNNIPETNEGDNSTTIIYCQ